MRLIRNIKSAPAKAASMKIAHFSNIGVTEVFLEATPTTFITTALLSSGLLQPSFGSDILSNILSTLLFLVGYAASILSSAFGVSKYIIFFYLEFMHINIYKGIFDGL